MKKLVLAFGFVSCFFVSSAFAAVDFSVLNVSQENADATRVGVRAGDVLRYQLTVSGSDLSAPSETTIDLTSLLSRSKIVNAGGGKIENGILSFPDSFCLNCDGQEYSFFVRANETCEEGKSVEVSFSGTGLSVPMHCQLAHSGPETLIVAIAAFILICGFTLSSRKETC